MSYRSVGIDVYKKMLPVAVADVEVDGGSALASGTCAGIWLTTSLTIITNAIIRVLATS